MKWMTVWVRSGDRATFFWVNGWRNGVAGRVMPLVTHLGGAVWSVGLSLALLLSGEGLWRETGVHLALSLLCSHAVVAVCKKVLPRPRPYRVLENVRTGRHLLQDASFPSGHSTAAFCTAAVLSGALPAFAGVWYGLAALVALSRVYLGLHYPSDILTGAGLGLVAAWLLGA
ncbi:undecaprenyl-diphosphatase [Tumebacillus sp. BK434]|uniref:phosphatase PAP2 family protein n=1 Tax=Tumebacillus sp. BK434 TaxID=2512169 RepID=UPI001044D74D|nr:phosphatase PAP2 family protein [Tumebacillus sp. BK434]TCP55747.1 undecaprenyl-diphosphatase [Tumebacillus sp. BK434]